MTDEKKHRLNVFLIKQEYQAYTDFITPDAGRSIEIPLTQEITGRLFYSGGFPAPPTWASIFAGIPEFDQANIVNQHSKALLAFKINDRWVCFAFGYSRHLINQGTFERNFGLIVALNLSDPSALKSIDKTNISLNSLQSREQASKEIEIESFGFNNDIDILKSITARTKKENLDDEDQVLSGRDSVSISSRIELSTFPEIANKLYEAYIKKDYLERYPWFDKIIHERDNAVIAELDALLLDKVKDESTSKVWLAVPEIVDWENTDGFTYKKYRPTNDVKKPGPVVLKDIDLDGWKSTIDTEKLTIENLKSKHIFLIDRDNRTTSSISVYRCMNAEVSFNSKTYILNDADWYSINADFEAEINQFYNSIADSTLVLPPYEHMTEPVYLSYVAASIPSFFLMDRKNIQIGSGYSKVEFCDLYSSAQQIIHVKNYSGSSVLSHLFNQAFVSAECFISSADFREQVNQKLGEAFKLKGHPNKPESSGFEVCIAIMSKKVGTLDLPFFSKVSLKNAITSIANLGYKVTKLKINQFT
ncbi:TIGR04141 family sporadically distributed protein [Methylotenera sp. N17]|uniref:TIGR04141 family sporadically distributed protein n=1 Tax=Methylotenera sp. N17 TaxID=1502761 RepID=UPI00064553AA|nr:TIGR04141 family sporadically distributed protein [Methylotenera sp. N17]